MGETFSVYSSHARRKPNTSVVNNGVQLGSPPLIDQIVDQIASPRMSTFGERDRRFHPIALTAFGGSAVARLPALRPRQVEISHRVVRGRAPPHPSLVVHEELAHRVLRER